MAPEDVGYTKLPLKKMEKTLQLSIRNHVA